MMGKSREIYAVLPPGRSGDAAAPERAEVRSPRYPFSKARVVETPPLFIMAITEGLLQTCDTAEVLSDVGWLPSCCVSASDFLFSYNIYRLCTGYIM